MRKGDRENIYISTENSVLPYIWEHGETEGCVRATEKEEKGALAVDGGARAGGGGGGEDAHRRRPAPAAATAPMRRRRPPAANQGSLPVFCRCLGTAVDQLQAGGRRGG